MAVEVRMVGRADAGQVAAMVRRCGPDSIWDRFLSRPPDAAQTLAQGVRLGRPSGRVDLGAFEHERLVGLGSLLPSEQCWEVALLVEDQCQGCGIGHRISASLAGAVRERSLGGIRVVHATANHRAARLVARWGKPLERPLSSHGTSELVVRPRPAPPR